MKWLLSSNNISKDGNSNNQDGIVPFNKLWDKERDTKLEGIWLTNWLLEELFEDTCVQIEEKSGSWPMKLFLRDLRQWVLQSLGWTT